MDKPEPAEAISPGALPLSQYWLDLSKEDAAIEALRPLFSFASIVREVGEGGKNKIGGTLDINRVLLALVERAEVILGIPDRSI